LELQNDLLGWAAQEGNQYAELDSDWDGSSGSLNGEPASVKIYQDIQTIPGEKYTVSFWFSPRPNTGLEDNRLEFSWGGNVVANNIAGAGENTTVWTKYTYTFTASSTSTRIQFADIGVPSDSLGTLLDNVSVKCGATEPQPICGDEIKNGTEQCDGIDGVGVHQSCSDQCALINNPYCGDQTCNNGEDCSICSQDCGVCGIGGDGGGGGGGGGITVHVATCGDGIYEVSYEQCDDGNLINGDGCSSTCAIEEIAAASTEEQTGEVLGESTTLPNTGGNPLWITAIALLIALGSAISIKKLLINPTPNSK
jgi:cysteine-rich repeat protein